VLPAGGRIVQGLSSSVRKESHLDADDLDNVVIGEPASLVCQRFAVDAGGFTALFVFNLDDAVAVRTACNRDDLRACPAQRCDGLVQRYLPTGKCAVQDLDFCHLDGFGVGVLADSLCFGRYRGRRGAYVAGTI
jgi:hypothetical protein